MDPPTIGRERMVRDYSTDGVFTPPSKQLIPAVDDRWGSPQKYTRRHSSEKDSQDVVVEDVRKLDFNLLPIDERDSYEHSVDTQPTSVTSSTNSNSTATSNSASNARLADFFGPEVFQIVLRNPTTAHQLKKFAQSRLCGENLEFLERVDQYHQLLNQVTKTVFDIHRNFVSVNSPTQLNLPEDVLVQINKNLKTLLAKTMPNIESVFLTAQNDIQKLVASDVYPRFVHHQITTSATKALATNHNKYAGLGDCFVLTNPNKADNPIVYASDGFVKVSGYERNEIIPRNCRFLQSNQTDRESVARIKKSLERPADHVELLLNQRKNGEPFWNLLYTAPLYDSSGKLAFFLGGQINVSTTIHNTSDVLRILSSSDDEEEEPKVASPSQKSYRQSFFGSLRKPKPGPDRTPGMENELLSEFQNKSFKDQKNAFYTTYSKYIIINTDTMLISFYSAGIIDLLFPARQPNATANQQPKIAGHDIFKFLSQYTSSGLARDYKSRVKGAIKSATAVSLDLSLCTRRIMGYEQFLTHWTPLKNDTSTVGFMVLTFGSLRDAR